MPEIDIEAIRAKLGTMIVEEDEATAAPLRGMVVTFDRDEKPPVRGEPIAPGWHWAYFPAASRLSGLGADGLPLTGGVLPEMPLPRRMYAGATLTFHAPILVGDALRRETEFSDVQLRKGGTGTLIIATQTKRFYTPRGLALTEDQVGVFREAVPPGTKSGIPATEPPPTGMTWVREWKPDPVSLFRYSALTFNGHRIHYDRRYVTGEEGYPGLIVHGPLIATLLVDLLRRNTDKTLISFKFRAVSPLFDIAPFAVRGQPGANGQVALWARNAQGNLAMEAEAVIG